ncbi:MAG: phosphoglycerate kinase [Bdellovibrionales bacterium]|nr:phosphoglycerate kinase [Bdellovibrionales bacterium]
MKRMSEIELKGKRVFIRADLNVPLDEHRKIADDTRIRAALETVKLALKNGASVILASHLGRPKGEHDDSFSLAPVAKRIGELLGQEVALAPDCVGEETAAMAKALKPGQVLLLENLRFNSGETSNDQTFAKQLAALADCYINDAFGTAHRAHASTAGIVNFIDSAAAGLLLENELDFFAKAFENPKRPLAAIFGGAKISTKLAAIKNTAAKADKILIGGAMANTFFAADGLNIGSSLYEPELLDTAREVREFVKTNDCELLLPTDVIVGSEFSAKAETRVVNVDSIPDGWMALDIGPRTITAFVEALGSCSTIIWNGPMGAFEMKPFSNGTYAIVDALAASEGLTVVGGGDTDLALHERHAVEKMGYVSTGGGAFLKLLEGSSLPAVEALNAK